MQATSTESRPFSQCFDRNKFSTMVGSMRKLFFFLVILRIGFLDAIPFRVGMELAYPPFEMICPDGTPCGISVDLAAAFGEFIGKEIEIENIPFVGLIPSLQNGMIDAIVSSLTVTERRKKVIAFSDPYLTTGLCLLLSVGSQVNTIEDANEKGRVIVAKSGTSGEQYARLHLPKATVRILDKESACVLEVIQKKADAFIYDQFSVLANWQKNPTTTKVNLVPFQREEWAFGISKSQPKLVSQVNEFLKKFREEGGFDRLADKYLSEQKKAFMKLGVPFVF